MNCGGNNSDSEIYCDWCGEKLLPERRMTVLLFLKYYLYIFAILGVIGAITYYIATFLVNPNNVDLLNTQFLGITVRYILDFGIFLCFCLFIGLLILLLFEITHIEKRDLSLKVLEILLLLLLVFVVFLFITIGSIWMGFIACLITIIFYYVLYSNGLDRFYFWESNVEKKSRNLLLIMVFLLVLFGCLMIMSQHITDLINSISKYPLPYENSPVFLYQVSNGFFVGFLLGDMICLFQSGILYLGSGLILASTEIRATIKDLRISLNKKQNK
jgi:hypothetical protein